LKNLEQVTLIVKELESQIALVFKTGLLFHMF